MRRCSGLRMEDISGLTRDDAAGIGKGAIGVEDMEAKEAAGPPPASIPIRAKRGLSRLIARITETLLPRDAVDRLRTGREWKRWVDSLTPEILDDLAQASPDVKRQVFKRHVRRVEIETHAKRNRISSFCP